MVTLPIHEFNKANMPYSVTSLIGTTMFEWCVVRCGSENAYQKHMYSNEIGLCAQNMMTILNSMVHVMCGDLYDHLMSTKNFLLIPNKVFIWSFKNYEESGYSLDLDIY